MSKEHMKMMVSTIILHARKKRKFYIQGIGYNYGGSCDVQRWGQENYWNYQQVEY